MRFRTMRKIFVFMVVLIGSIAMLMADQVAAWDSGKLDQPIAVDGVIRHNEQNAYSFVLNNPGIPEEPVVFRAELGKGIDGSTGAGSDGTQLFDPEKLRFITDGFTSYIGAKVTSISPDTTVYTDNGYVYEGTGPNVDLIEGAYAVLNLKYNPEYTHQTGALWFCVNDPSYMDFAALPGSSSCTVYGNNSTDLTHNENTAIEARPKLIRAVSIYDPWFDEMEAIYGNQARKIYREEHPEAPDAEVDAITWKQMYLQKSNEEHAKDGEDSIWSYPKKEDVSVYTEYLVTVRSPIEMVTFTAKSEYAMGETETSAPFYMLFNDQLAHPDMTSTNKIWCYDTSDASAGNQTVDAFRIDASLDPDYDYTLKFELVSGSAIGHLDFTELDGNTFRFVPKGEYSTDNGNSTKKNYGQVVIKVTAEEVNFVRYFTLMYVPSNMKLVKYIGEDMEGWDKGIVVDEKTGYVNDTESGEWDVVKYTDKGTGQDKIQLYGMECLVLYAGEKFELAMVQYVDNKDGRGTQPYYMTDGVYTVDYSKPLDPENDPDGVGYETDITKYAITYSVTKNDSPDAEPLKGVLEFEQNGEVVEAFDPVAQGVTEVLIPADSNTGQSYWYVDKDTGSYGDNSQQIIALKEGAYYLRYTVAPIEDEGEHAGEISMAESTLSGGIYLYIVSTANQALTSVVQAQAPSGLNKIMLEIPYRISAGQRRPGHDRDGMEMPSHWYLGAERGAIRYVGASGSVATKETPIYYGSAYGIFSSADYKENDLSNFNVYNGTMIGIGAVDFDEAFLKIYDKEDGKPPVPSLATGTGSEGWGGTMAITEGSSERPAPDIADILITGPYGLAQFPGIKKVRIIDTADDENDRGIFTEANISYSKDGLNNKIFALSELRLTEYEHANMGLSGQEIDIFYTPGGVESLNFDSQAVVDAEKELGLDPVSNMLDCEFVWGANVQDTLVELKIGSNRFQKLEINGLRNLRAVFASGALGSSEAETIDGQGRTLAISGCPKLEYVEASGTFFHNLIVQFPTTGVPNSNLTDIDTKALVYTILRANGSRFLRKVNVSGHLTYLELTNDEKLISVIGSNTFNANDPDSYSASDRAYDPKSLPEETGWVRVVNLGGPIVMPTFDMNPEITGFQVTTDAVADDRWLYSPDSDAIKANALSQFKAEWQNGSCNIEVLKFNYIYRLYSAAEYKMKSFFDSFSNSTIKGEGYNKSALDTLEVFYIVPDAAVTENYRTNTEGYESHYSSGNLYDESTMVYSIDYRHAGDLDTSVMFHHVPRYASINLSGGGMQSISAEDFQGFLCLYMAPNLDDLHINETSNNKGPDSTVEISRSGITNFTGTKTFRGILSDKTSIQILLPREDGVIKPATDSFTLSAQPDSFTGEMTITGASSSDNSVCEVSSISGRTVNLLAKKAGNVTIKVHASVPSNPSGHSIEIKVSVAEEAETPTYSVEMQVDGKPTDGVIVFETKDSPMIPVSLFASSSNPGIDANDVLFTSYTEVWEEGHAFPKDETGTEAAPYEQIYENFTNDPATGLYKVEWNFEDERYAEFIPDSYLGNKGFIKPLIDDQEFTGSVSYINETLGIEAYSKTFVIKVTGGAENRWDIKISYPSDDPHVFEKVGDQQLFTATIRDKQLLDSSGNPTVVSADEYKEDLVWSFGQGQRFFSSSPAAEQKHNDNIMVTALKEGSDIITVSYRNGAVSDSKNLVVNGEETDGGDKADANMLKGISTLSSYSATDKLEIPENNTVSMMTLSSTENDSDIFIEDSYKETFEGKSIYDGKPTVRINGEEVYVNLIGRTDEEAEQYASEMDSRTPKLASKAKVLASVSRDTGDKTVINVNVVRLAANYCSSLSDISITADIPVTNNGLQILEADYSGVKTLLLDENCMLQELEMNNTSVNNAQIYSRNISKITMRNNTGLGGGSLRFSSSAGGFSYSGHKISNGTEIQDNITFLDLQGCNIYHSDSARSGALFNGGWWGSDVGVALSVKVGSNLENDLIFQGSANYDNHTGGGPGYTIKYRALPSGGDIILNKGSNINNGWWFFGWHCSNKGPKYGYVYGRDVQPLQSYEFSSVEGDGAWHSRVEITVYPFG